MGKFSIELFDKICDEIAVSSVGLLHICEKYGTTSRSFLRWVREDEEKEDSEQLNLRHKYACAREDQAEFLADQIIEIADDSTHDTKTIQKGEQTIEVENTEWVNRSKLRVEARKWTASKLKPKKYGDKLDLTSGNEKLPTQPSQIVIEIVKPTE
jgi:hypothetical protein